MQIYNKDKHRLGIHSEYAGNPEETHGYTYTKHMNTYEYIYIYIYIYIYTPNSLYCRGSGGVSPELGIARLAFFAPRHLQDFVRRRGKR